MSKETKTPRKVINIAIGLDNSGFRRITSLCDDGSIWEFSSYNEQWSRIPDIPQD